MKMKLELVPIPVSDIDAAKAFYVDKLGFTEDHDSSPTEGMRVVQLTPKDSACSIVLSEGLPMVEMPVGSQRGLHLVVEDAKAAHDTYAAKGVAVGDVVDMGGGMKYVPFSDPDGNQWTFQEMPKGI